MKTLRPIVGLLSLVALTLLLAGCGPVTKLSPSAGAAPTAEAPATAVATSPAAPPAIPEPAGPTLTVLVWQSNAERFQRQAEQFTEETGIPVDVIVAGPGDYVVTLKTKLAAGEPIDLYLADPYLLPDPNYAAPLDAILAPEEIDAFLPGAVATFSTTGNLLALPVEVPPACEPWYQALALNPNTVDLDAAVKLLTFFTDDKRQLEAFEVSEGQALPTRTALFEELTVCPEALQPMPPLPGQSTEAIFTVEARKANLSAPLERYAASLKQNEISFETIDLVSELAVAATLGNTDDDGHKAPGLAAALPYFQDDDEAILAALAPVNVNLNDEEIDLLLNSETGVVLGGAFGVEAHDPPFTIEDYKLAPGEDVLVVARASSAGETAVDLFVVDGNGFETQVGTVERLELQNPVPVPLVFLSEPPLFALDTRDRVAATGALGMFRHRACVIDWRIGPFGVRAWC
jgi:hypothetical protein